MTERVAERFMKEATLLPPAVLADDPSSHADILTKRKLIQAKVEQVVKEVNDIGVKIGQGDVMRALHAFARSLPLMQWIAEDLGAEEAAKIIPKAQWAVYRAIKPLHMEEQAKRARREVQEKRAWTLGDPKYDEDVVPEAEKRALYKKREEALAEWKKRAEIAHSWFREALNSLKVAKEACALIDSLPDIEYAEWEQVGRRRGDTRLEERDLQEAKSNARILSSKLERLLEDEDSYLADELTDLDEMVKKIDKHLAKYKNPDALLTKWDPRPRGQRSSQ